MAKDIVPANIFALLAFLGNFVTNVEDYLSSLGFTEEEYQALSLIAAQLSAKATAAEAAKTEYHSRVAVRDLSRDESVFLLRQWIRRAQASPNMNDAIREKLGLKKQDSIPTGTDGTLTMEAPLLKVETTIGRALIHFGPKPGSVRGNTRPAWATGALISRKKEGEEDYRIIGYAAKSPFLDTDFYGPASDYTYTAAYKGKRETEIGPESDEVTVAVRARIAA